MGRLRQVVLVPLQDERLSVLDLPSQACRVDPGAARGRGLRALVAAGESVKVTRASGYPQRRPPPARTSWHGLPRRRGGACRHAYDLAILASASASPISISRC